MSGLRPRWFFRLAPGLNVVAGAGFAGVFKDRQ